MSKYDFILYARGCEEFIARLRELGLVDITTTGWEPSEEDRTLMLEIESYNKAIKPLDTEGESDALPYTSGDEAHDAFREATQNLAHYKSEVARYEKLAQEMSPWGDFSPAQLSKLAEQGLTMRYFSASESTYDTSLDEWSAKYIVEQIARVDGAVYFVIISNDAVDIDAQEVKSMSMTSSMALSKVEEIKGAIVSLDATFARVAKSRKLLEDKLKVLSEKLQERQIAATAQGAAEGSLLVMEGWAESQTSVKVDALLEEYADVVYFKSNPTPEDNTPVKLQNGWFASTFEMVANLYALPKYGTIDLTPLFAPFYMIFFAICLCDAGYGAIILAAGIALYSKGGAQMRQASWLSIICGTAAVIFGFMANSFLGLEISSLKIFEGFKFIDFQKQFFSVSMIIGIVQILFGMVVNIYVTTRSYGFKYALGSLGWLLLVASSVASATLTSMGVEWFGFNSIPYLILAGAGGVLMFFFNSPDKNIFANFGAGIWNTYDGATGLLGDVLSYIRLFAIGLSGGILALVFNDLAMGMTGLKDGIAGDSIVSIIFKVLGAAAILLIGHGLNLFMSTISSFVHPMRLTFVEFYKNAGFEMATRKFNPLK
ncbi:MAG: V-type ATP synthase subunit I [Rikenellaceae bacterium]